MQELQAWIDRLGQVGATGQGGVFRGTYMQSELEAHALTAQWMEESGLKSWRDAIGNLWGRVEGSRQGPTILTGSHLDTVKNGGNYDGVYGVLGGLIAVREAVRRYGPPLYPMEVVAFTNEESSRFALGLMGSRGVVGTLPRNMLDQVRDESGMTVSDGMRAIGLDPDRIGEARRTDIGAFLEMHIEQGRVLESQGLQIGIVKSIVGSQRISVTVTGQADHAGTTPMAIRKDALVGASRMISELPSVAARGGGVITVGRITALPGSPNVVPERVEFSIDCRHHDDAAKSQMLTWAQELCGAIAMESGLGIDWQPSASGSPSVGLSSRVQELLVDSCKAAQIPYLEMHSGAGHDAKALAGMCDTGMLFIPCRDGRSHTPVEYASMSDMLAGVEVLVQFLHRAAYLGALPD